jgi:hypothetical protein
MHGVSPYQFCSRTGCKLRSTQCEPNQLEIYKAIQYLVVCGVRHRGGAMADSSRRERKLCKN